MYDVVKRVEEIERKTLEASAARRTTRNILLTSLAELRVYSRTLVPCLEEDIAEPVDVERLGIFVLSLLEAAREEHRAMVADADARS